MTWPLIIGNVERDAIAVAVRRAKAHPIAWVELKDIAIDTPTGSLSYKERQGLPSRPPSQEVLLPIGFRVCFSIEEQPAGLVRHLSISVDNPGKILTAIAVMMIAKEFGFSEFPLQQGRVWVEEFAPGEHAVNVCELYVEREEGHA
jgi:hypothetical protein